MSVQSTAADVAQVDWNIVAGAVATFIVTAIISWQGFRKGKRKVESGKSELTPIVGATLMESTSLVILSEQLRDNTAALREKAIALRENTACIQRNTDILLLTHRDRN